MIDVHYRLHDNDGELLHEERRSEHVPRVNDLVSLNPYGHSYQVVDVLWHQMEDSDPYVTVTACEMDWHEKIARTTREWRASKRDI